MADILVSDSYRKAMSSVNVDRFFADEITAIELDSREVVRAAARELEADVKRQIRLKFNNPSAAFRSGIKVYDFENASYVRLSPILSSHARSIKIRGNPNLWVLLPDGARLGFKRLSPGFTYPDLKRRYGSHLSFVPVNDGFVVLYRDRLMGVRPIYKIQKQVRTTQRIEFYEKAELIAEKYGLDKIIGVKK